MRMRVLVSPTGFYTYPDVVAVCGEPRFQDNEFDTLLNPNLIVEVLSPSTEAYDRGKKFADYRRLESLREYVMVAQDQVHVDRYTRQGDEWLLTELSRLEDTLRLESIGCNPFGCNLNVIVNHWRLAGYHSSSPSDWALERVRRVTIGDDGLDLGLTGLILIADIVPFGNDEESVPVSSPKDNPCAADCPPSLEELPSLIHQRLDEIIGFCLNDQGPTTFLEFEAVLLGLLRSLGCLLIQLYLRAHHDRLDPAAWRARGYRMADPAAERTLKTSCGPVTYIRAYFVPRHGGGPGVHPLDVVLGLTRDGYSPLVIGWFCRLATRVSFQVASGLGRCSLGRRRQHRQSKSGSWAWADPPMCT